MTVEVQGATEVPYHWTRDYRVDGSVETGDLHPRKVKNPGASADLGQIQPHGVTVGIPATTSPFPRVEALITRAQVWDRRAFETLGAAQQELVEARAQALAVEQPTAEALNAYLAVKERLRPWSVYEPMNVEKAYPGRERRVVLAAKELGSFELKQASDVLLAATGDLYTRFARQAAQVVAQVQAVLPLSDRAWSALDPNAVLADEARNVLHRAEQRFNLCHYVALYLRAMGGVDDRLVGDEPPMAVTFRNWPVAKLQHHELGRIPKVLKLAYAVQHGWEPGLWTRGDLDTVGQDPARRRFMAFLGR